MSSTIALILCVGKNFPAAGKRAGIQAENAGHSEVREQRSEFGEAKMVVILGEERATSQRKHQKLMYSFARAVIINYHKLGGLNKCIVS